MRRLTIALILAVSAPTLAACAQGPSTTPPPAKVGSSWNEIVRLAEQEGKVTFYSHIDKPTMDAIEAAFEKKYPKIQATFVRLTGGEVVPRVDAERKANAAGADAMTTSMTPFLDSIVKDGQLAEIQGPDYVALRDGTLSKIPGLANKYYGTNLGASHIIVWNTNLVKEPITSYQNLLDRKPEFTNQLGVPDLYGDVAISFYLGLQKGFDGPQVTDPTKSTLVKGLAELKPRYFDSATPLTNAVAAGEVKAGVFSVDILVKSLKAKGAPIAGQADPKVPTSTNSYAAVTGWAQHPNAGQVLVNFLFSPEGQTVQAAAHYTPVLPNIPGASGGLDNIAPFPAEVSDKAFNTKYMSEWKSVFRK